MRHDKYASGEFGGEHGLDGCRRHRLLVGVLALVASVTASSFGVAAATATATATAAVAPSPCPNAALRAGVSAGLSDCRAYEMVSPVEKGSVNAVSWAGLVPAQAAADGERVFYQGNSAFPGAEGNSASEAGHLSVRTTGGWRTVELSPRTATLGPEREGWTIYQGLSEGLGQVIVKAPLALTPAANRYAFNLYARNLESEVSWSSPEYTWLNDLPLLEPTTKQCGEEVPGISEGASCFHALAFAGASGDFSHVLLESSVKLLEGAPANEVEALYENAGGVVRLVGVLPDKSVAMGGSTAGAGSSTGYFPGGPGQLGSTEHDRRVEHAISANGEDVVFQAGSDEGESNEKGQSGLTEVYDRIGNSTAHPGTIELSAPQGSPKVSTAEPATFWVASVDGSRVFFTSKAELTTASNTGSANDSEDLYEYDFETKGLRDLSVDTNAADASTGAGVLGVIGASENGEYVYFVADGQLVSGKGIDGKPNLYMERNDGEPVFIATLKAGNTTNQNTEEHEPGDSLDWTAFQEVQRAYVTPDGRHLGFMSVEKLQTSNFPSGYENKGYSEVYEYTAPSPEEEGKGGTGWMVCVSCDPGGAAPSGNAYLAGTGVGIGTGPTEEAGANLTPTGAGSPFHHVRSVSDDGMRVFFTATPFAGETAADPEETPVAKVYEYEQDGEGSCSASAGCIYRISSASNPTRDLFIDASSEGEDMFFATYSRLAPSDRDELMDVYDARVDGGFPVSEPVSECESGCRGEESSSPAGPPLVSGVSGPSGNVSTVTTIGKETTVKPQAKKLSCAAKAKKLKSAKRRERALRRCAAQRKREKAHSKGRNGR